MLRTAVLSLLLQAGIGTSQAQISANAGFAAGGPAQQTAASQSTAPAPATADEFRQPAFPGGPTELAKFLSRNLQYPAEAAEQRVSGRVMVTFWVDENGNGYGYGAVQSPHPALEAEALRVAKKIAHWEPGVQEGKPAAMQMYLPVTFKLIDP